MRAWKTLSRRPILDRSPYLTVEEHAIELPGGRVIPDWPWVITPDFINVVAVTEAGDWVCFRQTKYAVDGTSLAVVGGYLEPGEEPLAAAQRELLEETGYAADTWVALGRYAVDGNRGAGAAYPFLARGARRVQEPVVDDLEDQEMLLLDVDAVKAALAGGEFKCLPWAAAVALALVQMEKDDE
ncbi:MAG: NUDIX hydrolase [Anaerolineae bacterium]|nr:NUDIX hydrolase [Anaerolineae bacterium]